MMTENVGKQMKDVSHYLSMIGILVSIIAGLMVMSTERIAMGMAIGIAGSFLTWFGSLLLRGFGELVENSSEIVKRLKDNEKKTLDSLQSRDTDLKN
mgnify:CR=1 FL=1